MPFIPRGHVPLTLVVQRLTKQFTSDADAAYKSAQQGLRKVTEQQSLPSGTAGSRMLLQVPQDRTRAENLTEGQRVHVREMARHVQRIQTVRQIIANVIQQDLGMGDTTAIALSHDGEILEIPMRAWRTRFGELALANGAISWADSGIGMTPPADAFVADAVIERWIDMVQAAVRDMVDETESIVTTSGKPPTTLGPAVDNGIEHKLINRRADVMPEKANQWMFDVATAAKAAREDFGRERAVERCQEKLNCTREVARAAYTALPDELKQPRGKAIKKPA